jgi:ubiquinone biosynthesis protein
VALLDFSLVGRMSRNIRELILNLILGIMRKKARVVISVLLKLITTEPEYPSDYGRLEVEVDLFLEAHLGRLLKELNLRRIMNNIMNIPAQYQLPVPPNLLLLIKI